MHLPSPADQLQECPIEGPEGMPAMGSHTTGGFRSILQYGPLSTVLEEELAISDTESDAAITPISAPGKL